jgi:hypothetical protein
MDRVSWGRRARLYISPTSFLAADLTVAARTKDIASIAEAADHTATARDIAYEIHAKGAKEVRVEFGKLIPVGANADDTLLLRNAYLNNTDLFCLLFRDARTMAGAKGIRFVANVQQFPENLPENEAIDTQIVLSMTDIDGEGVLYEEVGTPYTYDLGEWIVNATQATAGHIDFAEGSPLFPTNNSSVYLNAVDNDAGNHAAFLAGLSGVPCRVVVTGPTGTTKTFNITGINLISGTAYELDGVSGVSGSYTPTLTHAVQVQITRI